MSKWIYISTKRINIILCFHKRMNQKIEYQVRKYETMTVHSLVGSYGQLIIDNMRNILTKSHRLIEFYNW